MRLSSSRAKKLSYQRQYKASIIGFVWLITASALQTLLIFCVYFQSQRAFELIISKPFIGLFSFLIITSLNLLLSSIFNQLALTISLTNIIFIIALGINSVKTASRNLPFLPDDLNLALEAGEMSNLASPSLILTVVAGILISLLIGYWLNKHFRSKNQTITFWSPLSRPVVFAVALFILLPFNRYVKDPAWFLAESPILKVKFATWNQSANYYNVGPIIGYLYNIGKVKINQPENYSKAQIASIVKKYTNRAKELNSTRIEPPDDLTIIYLMSESFTDPSLYSDYYPLNRDPIPYTRSIMNQSSVGSMTVSEYGGGTSNIEFETLTGLTSAFDFGTSFYNSILSKSPNFPSSVHNLRSQGYQTMAVHAYSKEMYKRYLVYPNLGFDKFIDSSKMQFTDKIDRNEYISDQQFYQQLMSELDKINGPSFSLAISMQNHVAYDNIYNLGQPYAETPDSDPTTANIFENYIQGLNYSDQALKGLIDYINASPKKIVLAFWGDHLPGTSVYQKLRDSSSELTYKTPLFIYTNFESNKDPIGPISPNYTQLVLTNKLNLNLSPFQALLADLHSEYPTLTINTDLSNPKPVLKEFQLIQYDLLAGQSFSQKLNFFERN